MLKWHKSILTHKWSFRDEKLLLMITNWGGLATEWPCIYQIINFLSWYFCLATSKDYFVCHKYMSQYIKKVVERLSLFWSNCLQGNLPLNWLHPYSRLDSTDGSSACWATTATATRCRTHSWWVHKNYLEWKY